MKATNVLIALVLATSSAGVFAAQPAPRSGDRPDMPTTAQKYGGWYAQGPKWVQQDEAQSQQLTREGFPQYSN